MDAYTQEEIDGLKVIPGCQVLAKTNCKLQTKKVNDDKKLNSKLWSENDGSRVNTQLSILGGKCHNFHSGTKENYKINKYGLRSKGTKSKFRKPQIHLRLKHPQLQKENIQKNLGIYFELSSCQRIKGMLIHWHKK